MEPLIVEFDVDATVDHAFAMWTSRTVLWWPRSHAMSGTELDAITFEPPGHVGYIWHVFFDRSEATQVDVTFVTNNGGTRVRIEQTGFERLGAAGAARRERTYASWGVVAEAFAGAV